MSPRSTQHAARSTQHAARSLGALRPVNTTQSGAYVSVGTTITSTRFFRG